MSAAVQHLYKILAFAIVFRSSSFSMQHACECFMVEVRIV